MEDVLQYANCSEYINCGGIGGISYPFWGVNRANYCGLPGFEVKCVDNAPMINMSNINYRILKTNDSAPSVTVARQDYWELSVLRLITNYGDISVWSITRSLPLDPFATGACKNKVIVPVFTTASVALEANQTTIKEVVNGALNWDCRLITINATIVRNQEGSVGLTRLVVDSVAFARIRPMQPHVMQKIAI
ncbi:Protein kinase superfamily protein [Prunus dulcis]|uniref:Protein kinase superfamily protein n=1 Tax=Prunus dulcis TaxID=3755 RepID=A0A4Y1R5W0_PRUDU|nr:Protein kinase superfamily protein [Prunus dulcis]